MVAIIKSSASLRNVLHFNENKVRQNVAQLIHSMNFARDTEQLGFTDKIKTLEKLTSLNERTKLNAVHISLNFDVSEKYRSKSCEKLPVPIWNDLALAINLIWSTNTRTRDIVTS